SNMEGFVCREVGRLNRILAVRRARNRGYHLAEFRSADSDDLYGDLDIPEVRIVLQERPVQAGGGLTTVDDLQAAQPAYGQTTFFSSCQVDAVDSRHEPIVVGEKPLRRLQDR